MIRLKRPMALLLCLCMVLGMLPRLTTPASAATITVPRGGDLNAIVGTAPDGAIIELQGEYTLEEPLCINKNITLSGKATIIPGIEFKPREVVGFRSYRSMLEISGCHVTIGGEITLGQSKG